MLELILAAPAFLIIMLAMVQISLIYVATEQTAYASRYAAKIASETPSGALNALNTGALKTNVDNVLQVGGLPQGSCRVILEHNLGAHTTIADPVVALPNCDCDPPATSLPSVSGAAVNESVRTTVCVPLDGNVPDFLSSFGFSIQDYVVEQSTTYLYEL
ncbi:pilus assembly protein [Gimesia alba]|uniref:pilus assembly protein n=1 Tax=Gimesia alba TaxID=2527973 RepID=UPI0018D8D7CB|nr:pilus assembly protein [Gimesia alba]